ncbi:helix-turn-helix domain-containing protein [Stenotrophomonas sp. UBA7606]|uniref:helix-turn-helix domain-containing protein n=1 Tax=Stenotrophomonas sp. UBA7606 TaxID=1947559 RepID=UPI0039C9339D
MHSHLRPARKKQGLTQAEVAARVGRDQATVAKWERGQHPVPPDIAPTVAKVLGLTVLDVLYGDAAPTDEVA